MSLDAVILMIVSMLILWGGLVLAIINLNVRGGEVPTEDEAPGDL